MRKCWPLRQKMSTNHMSDQHLPLEIGLCSYRICNVAKKCLGHFTQWHIKLPCWMTAVVGVNTRGCGWLVDVSDGTNACMPDKTPGFISAAILPNICNVSSDLLFSCESISDLKKIIIISWLIWWVQEKQTHTWAGFIGLPYVRPIIQRIKCLFFHN